MFERISATVLLTEEMANLYKEPEKLQAMAKSAPQSEISRMYEDVHNILSVKLAQRISHEMLKKSEPREITDSRKFAIEGEIFIATREQLNGFIRWISSERSVPVIIF